MTSKQRAYLMSLASNLDPVFQIGKSSLTPEITEAVSECFHTRELIKINVLETAPDDIKSLGEQISISTNSAFVQKVGNKITLYRPRKKDPKIILQN